MTEDAHATTVVGRAVPAVPTIADRISRLRTSGGNTELELIDVLLRRAGLRGPGNVAADIGELLRRRRTLLWRLAEVQKIIEDGAEDEDGRVLVRVSKPLLNFILTGRMDGDAGNT